MALIKAIENPDNGVVANYWRINSVIAHFGNPKVCRINLTGFISADARKDDKQGAFGLQIDFAEADVPQDMSRSGIYEALKKQSKFSGAVDDTVSYDALHAEAAKKAREEADRAAAEDRAAQPTHQGEPEEAPKPAEESAKEE